jgi:DNA-binding MarR family transcriptional regulator
MSGEEVLAAATAVRRGVTRLGRRLRHERPASGATLLQLSVLAGLNRYGPMTPGELAAIERVQPQSLTRTLASLEARHLVARQDHPRDRRRALLVLTPQGQEVLQADMRQRDSWLALAMEAHLTPAEQQLLRLAGELMERLAEADDVTARADDLTGTPFSV